MPSIKYVIELSNQEKVRLMEIVKKGNSPARTILRANILLASDKQNDKYMTVSEIANAYRTTTTTVQTVRASYCKKGLEATITRKKRETPPIPAKVTGEVEAHIIALACGQPPEGSALLTQNAHRAAEQTKAIPEYPHTQKGRLQEEKAAKTTPADNILQRMVDREAKRAEGKGVGYDRWAAKHNLKQMAATVTAYQQYGFSSPEELDEACSAAYAAMQESLAWLTQVEKTLNGKKELQRQVLAYSKTRPVRDGLKQQKNAKAKAAYRQKYESDFIIADAAARYFRENGISKLPSYKALQAEIETLIQEKNSGYNDYRAKREEYRRLQTVKGNIDQILHRERKPVKRQEQER